MAVEVNDREIELMILAETGHPAERKLALEELDAIAIARSKPVVEGHGELLDVYHAGEWIAEVYLKTSRGSTTSVHNPARKLRHDRGQGIISQPAFYDRHCKAQDGDVGLDKRFYVRYAMILFIHKNGSRSTRKVFSRKAGLAYRDDRSGDGVRRSEFVASFPKAFADQAEYITSHLEFLAPVD
jgi:hypothetical protein